MKSKALMVLMMLLVVACGGSDDYAFDTNLQTGDPVEVEIGSAEQAFMASQGPSFNLGTQTGLSRQRCNLNSAGQVCVIPPKKTLSVCVHTSTVAPNTSFSSGEGSLIRSLIAGFDSIPGWTFNLVNSACAGGCAHVVNCNSAPGSAADVIVRPNGVGVSGTAPTNVKEYVTETFNGLVNLTEVGVNGQWQNWTTAVILVDRVDINAKGTSATQDANGIGHAFAHGFGAVLGIGGQGGLALRASRNLFDLTQNAVNISTGEVCALQSFSLVNPGQFSAAPVGCPTE